METFLDMQISIDISMDIWMWAWRVSQISLSLYFHISFDFSYISFVFYICFCFAALYCDSFSYIFSCISYTGHIPWDIRGHANVHGYIYGYICGYMHVSLAFPDFCSFCIYLQTSSIYYLLCFHGYMCAYIHGIPVDTPIEI